MLAKKDFTQYLITPLQKQGWRNQGYRHKLSIHNPFRMECKSSTCRPRASVGEQFANHQSHRKGGRLRGNYACRNCQTPCRLSRCRDSGRSQCFGRWERSCLHLSAIPCNKRRKEGLGCLPRRINLSGTGYSSVCRFLTCS